MINNIQILRAFAAINVVVYHVILVSEKYGYSTSFLSLLSGWGKNGVDIFFVISGFIIFHTQKIKKKSFFEFLKQRFIRIIPIYWFLTLVIIIFYLINPKIFLSLEVTNKLIFSSFFLISQILNDSYPILNVGWTLEYEVFFYLLFSFFLIFRKINIILFTFTFFFIILFTNEYLFAEFLFGVLLGYFYHKIKSINILISKISLIIGCILLFLTINSLELINLKNNFDRMIFFGIPSTMILFGLIYIKQFKNKFLIFLGDASYSIYLAHYAILSFVYKLLYYFNFKFNYDLLAIICLIVSILSGCIIYFFIEKKINEFVKKKLTFF